LAVVVSLWGPARTEEQAVDLTDIRFSTSQGFNVAAFAVMLILAGLYITWW
jgi:SSS family solute:Na+ symporter